MKVLPFIVIGILIVFLVFLVLFIIDPTQKTSIPPLINATTGEPYVPLPNPNPSRIKVRVQHGESTIYEFERVELSGNVLYGWTDDNKKMLISPPYTVEYPNAD